jgi:hypothetical protein
MVKMLNAQQKIDLNSRNGLAVSYELLKLKDSEKKTTYLAIVTLVNENNYDLYYAVPYNYLSDGSIAISILENKAVCQTSVRNSKSVLGDNINFVGIETDFLTTDNKKLFKIKASSQITREDEFNMKIGEDPILTNTFLIDVKNFDEFDLQLNKEMIDGKYINNCGGGFLNLTLGKNENGLAIITQFVNSNQIIWVAKNNTTFVKSLDNSATILYNKADKSFTYTTTDGVNCKWIMQ